MKNVKRVNQLFTAIQNKNGNTLTSIFKRFASKWGMEPNSVRNMYYLVLKEIKTNDKVASNFKIDFAKIQNNKIIPFSELEVKNLVNSIDEKVAKGYSIRKACIELAKFDVRLMLRYQNKYRAIKNVQSKKAGNHNESLQKSATISLNEMPSNIIPFKKVDNYLTDKDLQSLFLGLVRVVKNSAVSEVSSALKKQCNLQAIEIRNLVKKLSTTKDELNESERENTKLKKEIELLKSNKIDDYAKFLNKLKLEESSTKTK